MTTSTTKPITRLTKDSMIDEILHDFYNGYYISHSLKTSLTNAIIHGDIWRNNNGNKQQVTEKKLSKNNFACLRSNESYVGVIVKEKQVTGGRKKFKIKFKCRKYGEFYESELKRISRGEFNDPSKLTCCDMERDMKRDMHIELTENNRLGAKLVAYCYYSKNYKLAMNNYKNELIKRLNKCCQRFYCGPDISRCIDASTNENINPHEIANQHQNPNAITNTNTKTNLNPSRWRPNSEECEIITNENESKSSNGDNYRESESDDYLLLFVSHVQRRIHDMNYKCKYSSTSTHIGNGLNFNIDGDMDYECLQLYCILEHFVSQTVQKHNKRGLAFIQRDRDGDKILASWTMYQCKTNLIGKYRQFILIYEKDFKKTKIQIEKWLNQNKNVQHNVDN